MSKRLVCRSWHAGPAVDPCVCPPSRGGGAALQRLSLPRRRVPAWVVPPLFLFGPVVLVIPGTEPPQGCLALCVNRLMLGDPLQCALSLPGMRTYCGPPERRLRVPEWGLWSAPPPFFVSK